MIPARDSQLVQILDDTFADAARRSGEWLVCQPGCTQCCVGVFAINPLDAARLQEGLNQLSQSDPPRAQAVRRRAQASAARLTPGFPGNAVSGTLDTSEQAQERFEDFANDEPCPVLDPATGLCDLYSYRPVTCRVFGPPVQSEQGLGVCELCYHGATEEEVAACEMLVDPDGLEAALVEEFAQSSGKHGDTVIAFALARS